MGLSSSSVNPERFPDFENFAVYPEGRVVSVLNEEEFMKTTSIVMSDKSPLPVEIDIASAWLLISGVQLATRHPGISKIMKQSLEHIARQFQIAITARHPEAEPLIEHGWDWKYDIILCPKCGQDDVHHDPVMGMYRCNECFYRWEQDPDIE